MALQTSGPISLLNIANEFGGTAPHSLSEYYGASAGIPSSGTISFSQFYGASSSFAFTISSNQTNADLRTLAINAGWNQSATLQATISSGVVISSNSTSTPALTISGSFPGGVTLINSGTIVGRGGNGGAGQIIDGQNNQFAAAPGATGGIALSVFSTVSINNSGTISGGGGGGGGGGSGFSKSSGYIGGGGGGGRSSLTNSSGGAAGYHGNGDGTGRVFASPGSPGTFSSAGAGGDGIDNVSLSPIPGARGGNGGNWGQVGETGYRTDGFEIEQTGGIGGAAGAAISGNSNITWLAFGTRLGPIT